MISNVINLRFTRLFAFALLSAALVFLMGLNTAYADDDDDASLTVSTTNNRDITRPGHDLTYEINVENTGNRSIGDVEVTSVVPVNITIKQVSGSARVEGQRVIWGEQGLSDGEKLSFYIMGQVKQAVSDGSVLALSVKVRSEDEGLSVSDTDTTVVQIAGQVKAATTETPAQAPAAATPAPAPAIASSAPVPVTAATGASAIGLIAAALGAAGLYAVRRFK